MCACMYMYKYACMHTYYIHTDGGGFFLKNPVLSTLDSSQTTIRCGIYPVIVNNKSLVVSFNLNLAQTYAGMKCRWGRSVQEHGQWPKKHVLVQ